MPNDQTLPPHHEPPAFGNPDLPAEGSVNIKDRRAASGRPNVECVVFGGAYWKGLVPGRPNDTLGTAISLLNVNPRIAERADITLAKSSRGQASRSEISHEVNCGMAVAPGLTFKPFAQFISHPDQSSSVARSGNNTHALFVGPCSRPTWPACLGFRPWADS